LYALESLAAEHIDFTIYDRLVKLPHFSRDLERDNHDEISEVYHFRSQINLADGVILCTPEYAGGPPGVLKNALDWTVSSSEFLNKPTALISASPSPTGGEKAHDALLYTLSNYLQAFIVKGGTLKITQVSKRLNAQKEVTDPSTLEDLSLLLKNVVHTVVRN
jgi:chromate reductase, NAD(P)H dehydrogenase (quinone)